ncbi:hypothetical protein I4U23_005832 [Adineta vaga]|nr:hypothetical protein I4U23_005832 [Adineta vaga]
MATLNIHYGSIIHLRFNTQVDTIIDGKISANNNKIIFNESYAETIGSYCSMFCDNRTIELGFPSDVMNVLLRDNDYAGISYLRSHFKVSNNWNDESINIEKSILVDTRHDSIENRTLEERMQNVNVNDEFYDNYRLTTLINNPSIDSLPIINKPECFNCLSELHEDNLECPQCTQVFCRECIESSYDDSIRHHCCPKCHQEINLSDYQRSTIIGRFELEGISVFKCLKCDKIPSSHRLCRDPNCAALYCYNCCQENSEHLDSNTTMKCPRCKVSNTYVSSAVVYFIRRIITYQVIETDEELSMNPSVLPKTVWREEDWIPEVGNLQENDNRIMSVIEFIGNHIKFIQRLEHRPRLIIHEPYEYACPESLQLSYWNNDPDKNCWENDTNTKFEKYDQRSIVAYISHFSKFTTRNTRLRDVVMLDKAFLDIVYDYDFTSINDRGKVFYRGPERYIRPCGWYRIAIRVLGKYNDSAWLGEGRNAWPVAYHGTATGNALPILRNGLLAGGSNGISVHKGALHGSGIYLSSDPLYSSSTRYAKVLNMNGKRYQIMFQVRVKHDAIRKTKDRYVWVCDNSNYVRPYGILYREIP